MLSCFLGAGCADSTYDTSEYTDYYNTQFTNSNNNNSYPTQSYSTAPQHYSQSYSSNSYSSYPSSSTSTYFPPASARSLTEIGSASAPRSKHFVVPYGVEYDDSMQLPKVNNR